MNLTLRKPAELLVFSLFCSLLIGCVKTNVKPKSPASSVQSPVSVAKKLNLGSGPDIRPGYDNIDLYFEDPRVIKMDIRNLRYADNTVDEVLCSHVLEHLSFNDVPPTLKEIHRVLRPGGRVIIDVPDLEAVLRHWLKLPEKQRWGFALMEIYGSQERDGQFHRTGFTEARLRQDLMDAGFKDIDIKKITSHGGPALYAVAIK